jgi:hypothetical protein
VALQANREQDWPAQKARIGGPVREMARFASIHPDGRMLKEEGTALIGVASKTGLFVS